MGPPGARTLAWPSLLTAVSLLVAACTADSGRQAPPSPRPTAAPVALASAAPTDPATATPPSTPDALAASPTAVASARQEVYVTGTGGQGLTFRQGPGGAPIGTLPDGT